MRTCLNDLGDETRVSVRFPATTEDLGGAAFAGQHDTYLNRRGYEDIATHVKRCWASLWSGRAIAYRRQAGFDLFATAMAVVIQEMAFCDVAGVDLNPITGNLGQQVFDANQGLGESVVGGEAQIDHFVVDKKTGVLIESQLAEKDFKIVARADGTGTVTVPLTGADRLRPSLHARQVAALSRLLVEVDALYGTPQDIEWGFEGDELRLLQSRPITRIPARWTRDESAERFPSVITPLAWALVEEAYRSLNYSFALMKLPPFRDKWFALFDHYVYGNCERGGTLCRRRGVAHQNRHTPGVGRRYSLRSASNTNGCWNCRLPGPAIWITICLPSVNLRRLRSWTTTASLSAGRSC